MKPAINSSSKSTDLIDKDEEETKQQESDNINDYFAKEFKLWDKFLTQYHFKKKFKFRLFGYDVDIKWFTISFVMQIAFGFNVLSSLSKKWKNLEDWACL